MSQIFGGITIDDTYTDSTISGTPIIIRVDIDGTPHYFKAYPTKV